MTPSNTVTSIASQTSHRNELLTNNYASIDIEFRFDQNNKNKQYSIFAVAIVDSLGNTKVRHESHFANYQYPEKELVLWVISEILRYRLTIGWYSKGVRIQKQDGTFSGKDSDLKIIDDVCQYYDIPSIIGFDKRGVPYIRGYDYHLCVTSPFYARMNKFNWYYHIDLYQIYNKPLVKIMIYQNKYKDLKLDTVTRAILDEGKFEQLDGLQIQNLPKEKQIEYVAQDANLVMKLSKHNNYEILDLMNAISIITNVPFDRVCHTGISTWWNKIIADKLLNGECKLPTFRDELENKKRKYIGGEVIPPIIGVYKDQKVYVLDVKSLYPTMMINNNISFETVNCDCCMNKPEARVSSEIMNIVNKDLPKNQKRQNSYWICKNHNYKGIIPRLLSHYRTERFRQQELGNNSMQLALKNLINGIYGLFGSEFFDFSDYRVAELTTAFGRQTLKYMQHIAEKVYGFKVIYGDTDSIFVTDVKKENDINKFLAECTIVLEDIEIELANVYDRILIIKKKHYLGITKEGEIIVKGMEGAKNDRPPWINNIFNQFAKEIATDDVNALENLRNSVKELEEGKVDVNELKISIKLSKDPDQYIVNNIQKKIGLRLNLKAGDVIQYYKSDNKDGISLDPDDISIQKYKAMLWNSVKDILELTGHDIIAIEQDLILNKSNNTTQNPSNIQFLR